MNQLWWILWKWLWRLGGTSLIESRDGAIAWPWWNTIKLKLWKRGSRMADQLIFWIKETKIKVSETWSWSSMEGGLQIQNSYPEDGELVYRTDFTTLLHFQMSLSKVWDEDISECSIENRKQAPKIIYLHLEKVKIIFFFLVNLFLFLFITLYILPLRFSAFYFNRKKNL